MTSAPCFRTASAVLALLIASLPAHAEAYFFRTPSNNIYCAYDDYDGTPYIRCDMTTFTPTIGPPPSECDLDWGDAFEISPNYRRGEALCHGDTVKSPDASVLPYGATISRGGLACTSERSGLTCTNNRGHGFFLSRAKQKLF